MNHASLAPDAWDESGLAFFIVVLALSIAGCAIARAVRARRGNRRSAWKRRRPNVSVRLKTH